MRCGPDHHTVNFVRSQRTQMHHIAFELKDWAQIQSACDFLGSKNIQLAWGPGRHGPGHNIYTYHRNPDDQIIELFTELDKMLDEDLATSSHGLGTATGRRNRRRGTARATCGDRRRHRNIFASGTRCASFLGIRPNADCSYMHAALAQHKVQKSARPCSATKGTCNAGNCADHLA